MTRVGYSCIEDIGVKNPKNMKELAYETTDKQKKGFLSGLYH